VDGILRFDYLKSVSSDDRFEKSIDTFHLLLRRGADPDLPIISDFSGSVLTSENMLTTKSLCKKNKHLACARIMLDAFQARAEFNNFMKPNADDAEKCIKKAISSDAGLTYLFMRDLVANPDIALERKQQLFDHYQNSGLIEKYKLNVLINELGKFLISKVLVIS